MIAAFDATFVHPTAESLCSLTQRLLRSQSSAPSELPLARYIRTPRLLIASAGCRPLFGILSRRTRLILTRGGSLNVEPAMALRRFPPAHLNGRGRGATVRSATASIPSKILDPDGIAEWLVEQLFENRPTLVGIDHGSALFRGAWPEARLARLPRRFPAPLADRRGHLRRFRVFPGVCAGVWKRFDQILKEILTPTSAPPCGAESHALRVSQTRI